MKKLFALLLLSSFSLQSFAVGIVTPHPKAAEVFFPIGTTGQRISLLELSRIDVKNFETRTGRHLGFMNRMGFKLAQRNLRNSIKPDGTIHSKKLERYLKKGGDPSTGFHMGGFALGFFVGLIGVLIAYMIDDDYKRNRVKWAWIGFGIFAVLYIALVVALLSQVTNY
jgi:hypothetical protein